MNSQQKPFCKVCYDAKKSKREYTSHWVRSSPDKYGKSKVVCPTLLAYECNYCHKYGHTIKYCPILQERAERERRAQLASIVLPEVRKEKKTRPAPVAINAFACLALSDSESDSESDTESKEEVKVVEAPSWASIVSSDNAALAVQVEEVKQLKLAKAPSIRVPTSERRWADWADDSDSDEE